MSKQLVRFFQIMYAYHKVRTLSQKTRYYLSKKCKIELVLSMNGLRQTDEKLSHKLVEPFSTGFHPYQNIAKFNLESS